MVLAGVSGADSSARRQLFVDVGLSETGQTLIENKVLHWRHQVEQGTGSQPAFKCFNDNLEQLPNCLELARADGDALGCGMISMLASFVTITSQDMAGALKSMQAAASYLGPVVPEDDPFWATVNSATGVLLAANHQYKAAVESINSALLIERKFLGDQHFDVAVNLFNLGASLAQLQAWPEAEAALLEADDIFRLHSGNDQMRAMCLGNVGALRLQQDDPRGATPFFERALQALESLGGPVRPALAVAAGNLAESLRLQGAYAAALPHYQRALEIVNMSLGPSHPQVAIYLERLAMVHNELANPASARHLLERVIVIREAAYGSNSPEIVSSLEAMADTSIKIADFPAAEKVLMRALHINEASRGPESAATAGTLGKLGELYRATGDYASAKTFYARSPIWQRFRKTWETSSQRFPIPKGRSKSTVRQ